ncbi:MAG: protein kinase, partial [Planctomycetota bacterium]
MPSRLLHVCNERAAVESLAAGELSGAAREQAERHLEQCQPCRTLFRQHTAARYPRIRNYTILAELGRGGFGVVYKALHHSKRRAEALKVLFGASPQRAAYFENEVKLVAQLRHPNIATLYEASLSADPLYYAMELVEGEQLDAYFRHKGAALEERIALVAVVARAIAYAHTQGVIHRDLKPQNILIDAQGQPHIVDFGIAKRLGLVEQRLLPETRDGAHPHEAPLGTYGYVAPEQLAGESVDARADIYSLGALLFHVITGEPARLAPEVEHLTRVLHEREVARAEDLAAIIACCVNPVPEQRYSNCDTLVADLEAYLAGRGPCARREATAGDRARRLVALVVRNHPLALQAAAAALLVAVLTWVLWQAGIRWLVPGAAPGQTAIIAFTPSTFEALRSGQLTVDVPGLDPAEPKSRRLLYGRLMERLAGGRASAVVWDYFFPDSRPEYDPAFVRGVRALGAPVIVGTQALDINGEPLLAPELRAAVHGWGLLSATRPRATAINVPLAVQRGFNPPMPTLALAAVAAVRHPDTTLEIVPRAKELELRYRRRSVAPGTERYLPEVDKVPVFKSESDKTPASKAELSYHFGRFHFTALPAWAAQPIPMERVLKAEPSELRRWFAGRPVLIGQMLPGYDEQRYGDGERAFGCQLQACFLDDLLAQRYVQRVGRATLLPRVALCALIAGMLVWVAPTRRLWRLRQVDGVAALLVLAAFALAVFGPRDAHRRWQAEALIACASLLASGAVLMAIRMHHERAWHLTPRTEWAAESATASTTVLATSPASSSESDLPQGQEGPLLSS